MKTDSIHSDQCCEQSRAEQKETAAAAAAAAAATAAADLVEFFIDVTHKHPWVRRHQEAALAHRGAAAKADADKVKRYPPTAGFVACPAAVETWGVFGEQLEGLLDLLVARWARGVSATPHAVARKARLWRAALGVVQVRVLAKHLAAATACSDECV